MRIDAIVLAGGRSSRLGGVPKAHLRHGKHTLLEHTIAVAAAHALRVVVVGDVATVPEGILTAREDPPFGGPAAGLAAGDDVLVTSAASEDVSDFTLVLACDMPRVEVAVAGMLAALTEADEDYARLTAAPGAGPSPESGDQTHVHARRQGHTSGGQFDGVIAVDASQNRQPLAAIYSTKRLRAAIDVKRRAGALDGLSVFSLIGDLALVPVFVPSGSTDDVDTWADAERFGMRAEPARRGEESA